MPISPVPATAWASDVPVPALVTGGAPFQLEGTASATAFSPSAMASSTLICRRMNFCAGPELYHDTGDWQTRLMAAKSRYESAPGA